MAPWVLGFADRQTQATIVVVVGLLVTAFAAWAMLAA
jgi:hypothetical protein